MGDHFDPEKARQILSMPEQAGLERKHSNHLAVFNLIQAVNNTTPPETPPSVMASMIPFPTSNSRIDNHTLDPVHEAQIVQFPIRNPELSSEDQERYQRMANARRLTAEQFQQDRPAA